MVQNLPRLTGTFPPTAPAAYPVFYRTYSRRNEEGTRESWLEVCQRTLAGLQELGNLSDEEVALIAEMQQELKALTSGRWLWVGGTDWVKKPENFSGGYNCTSTNVIDWRAFGLMMDLAMQGCGTGAVLEDKYIQQLPAIRNPITVEIIGEIGKTPAAERHELSQVEINGNQVNVKVGDSRQGWVKSYQTLLETSTDPQFTGPVHFVVDISDIRPTGESLKGFGGVANPVKLPDMYQRCANILNKAVGRQLNSVECCLLIDEAAVVVVAGNVRRCLPEDALVHTSKGLVPIKDVQIGDLVQTPLGFRPVTNKFEQGEQDVYEIETNATLARATLNHRIATLADATGTVTWKFVAALAENDRLLHNTQVLPGTITHLPPDFTQARPQNSRNASEITIPDLTPDVAWLIGLTHGDGYVSLGRNKHDKPFGAISWAYNALEPQLADDIHAKINRALALFGVQASQHQIAGENTVRSRVTSIRLTEYFHRHIKQPKQPLRVPNFILQGTVEIRCAYLAGLMDSDGSAQCRPPYLLTTVYRTFAREVGVLLSSLGIAARISMTEPQLENWQPKYNLKLPALKSRYNSLIAPHSLKGEIRQGLKMYGFTIPGAMMRETYTYSQMRGMGFEGSRTTDSNYETYVAEAEVNLDIPVTVRGLGSYDHVPTYDIEVAEAHCFYCDGYLTHNSAGMRQGGNNDPEFTAAKQNLWQQDENGNWRIDPERDSLRMANHTRVFHRKPNLEETTAAVRQQYYSGEGAIQWAGEAVARANADLLTTPELKKAFIQAYDQGQAKDFLAKLDPNQAPSELEHRLGRYGLNPCVTAETWIHTGDGPRQVKDLIGQQHSTYVNGELFSTTPEGFFFTGIKPVVKLETKAGFSLRLTPNHQVLKVTAQTQKKQYSEWVEVADLRPGDRILLHNHRDLQPWDGVGTAAEGWLLGSLLGDGSLASTQWHDVGLLRFWQESRLEMSQHARELLATAVDYQARTAVAHEHKTLGHRVINSTGLAELAAKFGLKPGHKAITPAIEQASYEFYQGFLQGLFDADGSVQGNQVKGVSVRLAQSNLETLQAVQRMLARLGIIATIYQNRRAEGLRLLPNSQRQPSLYNCQAQHELVISQDNLPYFQDLIGFREPAKQAKLQQLLSGYQRQLNRERFAVVVESITPDGEAPVYDCSVPGPNRFDANGLVAHNCGEIIGENYHCNLAEVHLNQIDPKDTVSQEKAFKAGALSVAALLNHQFQEPRYRYSREIDPIVGVSFTGLFDFFVQAFGVEWLKWWSAGRPNTVQGLDFKEQEAAYLNRWREIVHQTVWDYCDRHGLRRPNRCTTVQPSGTKSLLTGASPGWHPPKAQRFIRRITFRKNDPVALACYDYGYTVIPSQSDKDETGNLLNDPFDPRCTEWLVEIPVAVAWADIPGADQIDISQFSALAQFDFYMQVQTHYTRHNTSATIELREAEVEPLAAAIHQAIKQDQGYISAALLARFDDLQTFPRLPFEPVDKARYEAEVAGMLKRQRTADFYGALQRYTQPTMEAGPAGCDSDKCMMPETQPKN